METRIRIMQPQANECLEPPEVGSNRKEQNLPSSLHREHGTA